MSDLLPGGVVGFDQPELSNRPAECACRDVVLNSETGTSLDNLTLQDDEFPQQLTLKRYASGWTLVPWLRPWRPHPLFCGRAGAIEVFPDHMHEGQLEIPAAYPAADWPSGPGGQPLPEIIAKGTDKRNGQEYGVTSAYDGAEAGVGRIVADSTWHHYFNINLDGFAGGSPTLEAIADFYVNLGVWLSPSWKRRAMQCWNWWYLATHSTVQMVALHPFAVVGGTGLDVRVFRQADAGAVDKLPGPDELVRAGLQAALEEHVGSLRTAAKAAGKLASVIAEKDDYYEKFSQERREIASAPARKTKAKKKSGGR